MPKSFQYKSGALIYFQGDPADKVCILQSGKVSLVFQNIETGEDVRDPVQPGEFFGVKSAMGRYPREENAIALADSTIITFSIPEFESLAMANTRIIMKMLKVFSNQMRRIHTQVSSLMEEEAVKPDEGLFNVGEYYLKNKRYSQAKYVFSRYLTYYPSGKDAAQAAKKLEEAESALGKPGDDKASAAAVHQSDLARAYTDAVNLVSQGKYQQAIPELQKIAAAKGDPELTAQASCEIGRCLFLLNQFDDCIKHYTAMLTQYPRHPDLRDVMFYIGQSNEQLGRKDQAMAFYRKILSMAAAEGDETTAKTKRAFEALGG